MCGFNGLQYNNKCQAACANVRVEYEGECKKTAATKESTKATTTRAADPECMANAVLVAGACVCPKDLEKTECKNTQGFCCSKPTESTRATKESTRATTTAAATKPLNQAWLKDNTERGNPNQCYYALLSGKNCADGTTSGVYLISEKWYYNHGGGSYADTSRGCGSMVESWPDISPYTDNAQLGTPKVRRAFSGRNLHSRMPLDPTPVRLKRTGV